MQRNEVKYLLHDVEKVISIISGREYKNQFDWSRSSAYAVTIVISRRWL